MHRNRRNRRRPKMEEEKATTNELAHLRVAKIKVSKWKFWEHEWLFLFCFTTEWLNCISCTVLILCIIHLGISYSNPFSFCFQVVVFLIFFFFFFFLITTETVSVLRFCVSIYLIMLLENGLSSFSGTQICCGKGHFETICLFDLGLCKNLFACNHCCFLLVVSQHECSLYLNSVWCAVFMLEVTFKYFGFLLLFFWSLEPR